MWKLSASFSLINILLVTVQALQNNFLTEYSIAGNNPMEAYYYPAPPKALRLLEPTSRSQLANDDAVQSYQNQYQASYRSPYTLQHSTEVIAKQFAKPALDETAFNLALNHQGYKYYNTQAYNPALKESPSLGFKSSTRKSSQSTGTSSTSSSSPSLVLGSLNVKLPLSLNITPLNIAPLPLQAGTPYAAISNTITSYGTSYHQRKRR